MPYPSPTTYPAGLLFPGVVDASAPLVAVGDLVMNTVDEFGVQWVLSNLEGWGSPGSTAQATQRAAGNGATMSAAYLKPRVLVGTGSILTEDPALLTGAQTTPFSAGVDALLYVDGRMRREGLDIQLIQSAQGAAAPPWPSTSP